MDDFYIETIHVKIYHIKDRRNVFDMDDFYIETIHVKIYHIQRFILTCTSTRMFSNLESVRVNLYHKE